jgi:hypothetical protein
MQLSLIRKDYPGNLDYSCLWINSENKNLYYGQDQVFLNSDDIDAPATLGDLDRELEKRNYFVIEPKFIDSFGDLVLNTFDTNIKYNKKTRRVSYSLSEILDEEGKVMGVTIRTYKRMEADYLNIDTSLLSIDLLDGTENCKIVFPEDKVSSVSLVELSKKIIIPGVRCVLDNIVVSYLPENSTEYVDLLLYDRVALTSISSSNSWLFKYSRNISDNQYRRVYNNTLSDTVLELGFILDLTDDGILNLYYSPSSLNGENSSTLISLNDYYIKSCSIRFLTT